MDLVTLGAYCAIVTLPVAACGAVLAAWLAFHRARRAERRLRAAEELLRLKVFPYLERRLRELGGVEVRRPAVVVGADGAIVLTSKMAVADDLANLVGRLEDYEPGGDSLATSATQQVEDSTPPAGVQQET